MNRPRILCDTLLLVAALTVGASASAQQTPASPATPAADSPPAVVEVAPTSAEATPAPTGPVVDTVVITAGTQPEAEATATTTPAEPSSAPVDAAPVDAVRVDAAPVDAARRVPVLEDIGGATVVPIASPFWVMGTVDHRWNTSPAFDLYADEDVTHFYGLTVGYDVWMLRDDSTLTLREKLALTVELGWNAGGTERDDFASGFTRGELFTHNITAAITGRYELLPWLAPHARLSLGWSVADMKLSSADDNTTFEDQAIAPMFGVGVGTSVQTAPGALASRSGELSSLRLGVRFELGYTFVSPAGFALKGDNDVRVPVSESSLGGLPRSGPHIHTDVFVRF